MLGVPVAHESETCSGRYATHSSETRKNMLDSDKSRADTALLGGEEQRPIVLSEWTRKYAALLMPNHMVRRGIIRQGSQHYTPRAPLTPVTPLSVLCSVQEEGHHYADPHPPMETRLSGPSLLPEKSSSNEPCALRS